MKKALVLDVRGTLMCEINARVSPELVKWAIRREGDVLGKSMILKRPHLDSFLGRMAELFNVVAFTSRARSYADKTLDLLDPRGTIFTQRLYHDSCQQNGRVKDLAVLRRPLEQLVMVEDTCFKGMLHPDNVIPIPTFKRRNLETDRELLDLMPFVEELAKPQVEDVRPLIRAKFGETVAKEIRRAQQQHEQQAAAKEMMKKMAAVAQDPPEEGRGSGRINSLGRTLTKILRHRAAELDLELRRDGFCRVDDLLDLDFKTRSGIPLSSHTRSEVLEAVEKNEKQRLSTMVDEEGVLYVRANQGHTLLEAVASEELLREIKSAAEVPVCVHGTYKHAVAEILREGLKTMGRKHVHLAKVESVGTGDVSGLRSNCEVLVYVDVGRALKDGMKFYVSDNAVVLTEGLQGCIPPKYFSKVVEWPANKALDY